MPPSIPGAQETPRTTSTEPTVGAFDGAIAVTYVAFFGAGLAIKVGGSFWNPAIPYHFQQGGETGALISIGMLVLHALAAWRYRAVFLLLLVAHILLTATRISHPNGGVAQYAEFGVWAHRASLLWIGYACLRLGGFLGRPLKEPEPELW